jgi:hypothetical protein
VLFGSVAVEQIFSSNDTAVVVAAGAGAAASGLDVTFVADSGARTVSSSAWEFLAPATFTSVSPSAGQNGTRVTLRGSQLLSYGTMLSAATLSGVQARVVSANDTVVVLVAGASNSLAGDIVLTSDTSGRAVGSGLWNLSAGRPRAGRKPKQRAEPDRRDFLWRRICWATAPASTR